MIQVKKKSKTCYRQIYLSALRWLIPLPLVNFQTIFYEFTDNIPKSVLHHVSSKTCFEGSQHLRTIFQRLSKILPKSNVSRIYQIRGDNNDKLFSRMRYYVLGHLLEFSSHENSLNIPRIVQISCSFVLRNA